MKCFFVWNVKVRVFTIDYTSLLECRTSIFITAFIDYGTVVFICVDGYEKENRIGCVPGS